MPEMLASVIEDHAGRLAAFKIGEHDIAALHRQRDRVVQRLPAILNQLDRESTAGRQVEEGLLDGKLKQERDAYWHCIATGQLGTPFVEAATAFAQTSYAKGIPSRAFAIRHSSGGRMLVDVLFAGGGVPTGAAWAPGMIRRQLDAKHRARYATALHKALWLGLSIVLEAYANVEAEERRATTRLIERSFAARIANVSDVLGTQVIDLDGAVVSISASAGQTTNSADMLADDALKASRAVREISASTDELARSISYIGQRIAQCAQSAGDATVQARLGDSAVAKLADSTAAIDQITSFINQIADQTKLLALNATIEAARAGQAGRGFAVVASEVTSLAKQTSGAISRVSQQVSLIRGSAQESSAAIHSLADRIADVSSITSMIAASVLQQGAVTQGIAMSVKEAALGNEQVSKLMTTMKVEASRSLDLAGKLAAAAAGIGLQGTMVRDITQKFMSDVHAAQRSAKDSPSTGSR